jgi:hypothetical protein
MKRKAKRYDEGGKVYKEEDEGLGGAKIKYREEEGRKYTEGKANPFDRNPQEQRYYSMDDVKDKLSGLFGGKKEDTSKYNDLKSVGEKKVGVSPQEEINRQIRGSKSEPKADAEKPIRKFSDYNQSGAQSTVDKKDAPYEVEKTTPPISSGSGSSNKSAVAKTSSGTSKAAESKYKPNEDRKSKPYLKDVKPLKPITNEEKAAIKKRGEQDDADQESLRKQFEKNTADDKAAADQLKKNKSVAFKQNDSTDKIIDKTVKDTSGAKTVYSDKPFSFTKNLQDKKDKEKKDKEKKDEDSKVSGPGGRMIEKNVRDFKGPSVGYTSTKTGRNFSDEEAYKRMKDANKASLRSIETENQRTFKERAEAAKAEADKAEKKAEKKAAKDGKPAKVKASSTAGKMPGPKMSDPNSMTLGSDLDPKRMMRDRRSSGDNDYKKGGSVSSASSRGDGIAARGKTRGRIY